MTPYSLSIVLPCYNPPIGWFENALAEFAKIQRDLPAEHIELIIVNDGSTKYVDFKTLETRLPVSIRLFDRAENFGKGYTLREGVQLAQAERVIFTDIDFPYTHDSFLRLFHSLQTHEVAIGVRAETYYQKIPKARVYISKILRFLIRNFLRISTDVTLCGLKGFNQKGKELFFRTTINGYLFDVEFIFLASRHKLSIEKVPVTLRDGIVLSKLGIGVLLVECKNFLILFFKGFLK